MEVSFLGVRTPTEVRQLVKLLNSDQVDQKKQYRKILELVVMYIERGESAIEDGSIDDDTLPELCNTIDLKLQYGTILFAGLYAILKKVVRLGTKSDKVEKDLEEIRFPSTFLIDLCSVIKKSSEKWEKIATPGGAQLNTLRDFSWRTDVVIASDGMNRVMQPAVLLRLATSDGTVRTVQAAPEEIEALRLGVTRLLGEMGSLEQLKILQIKTK
mmetsp:Transcript_18277/g.31837  ORF Transcript_18277/g.31837 Transcript_18277/m.31837 type:complete len:214 (+) Transcript_18277:25-666(+)